MCVSRSHIVCCKRISCHEITWCVEYHYVIIISSCLDLADSTTSEWTWNLQVWHRDLYRKELQRDLMIEMFVAWVKIGILHIFLATNIWQKKNSRVWTWTLYILSIIGEVIGITAVDGSEIPFPTTVWMFLKTRRKSWDKLPTSTGDGQYYPGISGTHDFWVPSNGLSLKSSGKISFPFLVDPAMNFQHHFGMKFDSFVEDSVLGISEADLSTGTWFRLGGFSRVFWCCFLEIFGLGM